MTENDFNIIENDSTISGNEKRFILIDGVKLGTHSGIWDNQKKHNQGIGDELWIGEVVAMLNEGIAIVNENKQLKQRNERQCHRLKKLRGLIGAKDWETLMEIDNQIEEDYK